jgi:hypothetical protein
MNVNQFEVLGIPSIQCGVSLLEFKFSSLSYQLSTWEAPYHSFIVMTLSGSQSLPFNHCNDMQKEK